MAKLRLDQLLFDRGLAESRSKAQALVMAGVVFSGDKKLDKPGQQVAPDIEITIKGQDHPWVSRGGLKLSGAIAHFNIDVKDKVAADLGASTGGFTDVLLHNGARKIYAIDVGQGQLAWKLQQDTRVVVMDKTNVRHAEASHFAEKIDVIVSDLSFISLKTALPAMLDIAAKGAQLIALIKPQFEVGKDLVGKGGIVRDPELHRQVCNDIESWLREKRWDVRGVTESPITGQEGNREFLIYAVKA